mmetsp:Transcript_606/g.1393  ORF Transcript_606/g.1393 Transcript_606/m.1393 type:complete len:226 (-) Transcript_606:549-1226(-)
MTSPSCTTYSLPLALNFPAALQAASPPCFLMSSKDMVSAMMKPFSKSVWITPAAWGALVPVRMPHALTSPGPHVKKQSMLSAVVPALMIFGRALWILFSLQNVACSSADMAESLASRAQDMGIIWPPPVLSRYSLILGSHLFFFLMKSSSPMFSRKISGLAVRSCSVFKISTSRQCQSPWRTSLPVASRSFTLFIRSNFLCSGEPGFPLFFCISFWVVSRLFSTN